MRRVVCVCFAALISLLPETFGQSEVAPGVALLGRMQIAEVIESSGLVPSRRMRGAFWTHNDSGLDVLYGMTADGQPLGRWKLKDVDLQNWEDTASAGTRLYIADIGNNDHSRDSVFVYMINEPHPRFSGEVRVLRGWRLTYPDGEEFDAECLVISRGAGYIISKELSGGEARIYRFPLNTRRASVELQPQGKLNVNAPPGGAAITPDNKRLAVITRDGAYLFTLPRARMPVAGQLDPTLFVPYSLDRMEGCAFTPDGLIVTAESGEILLFTDSQFRYGVRRPAKR